MNEFDYKTANIDFFDELVEKVVLITRERLDTVIDQILHSLSSKN